MCFLCEPSGLARIQSIADACGAVMETSNKRTENKGLVQTIRISLTLVGARCGQSWFVLVRARSTKLMSADSQRCRGTRYLVLISALPCAASKVHFVRRDIARQRKCIVQNVYS